MRVLNSCDLTGGIEVELDLLARNFRLVNIREKQQLSLFPPRADGVEFLKAETDWID